MDSMPQSDLNRMVMVIEQEVTCRIKELKIRATEVHQSTKAEIIENERRKLLQEFDARRRIIENNRIRVEGMLRNSHRKKVLSSKHRKIEELVEATARALVSHPLDQDLVEECLEIIGPLGDRKFYVFVKKEDLHILVKVIRKYSDRIATDTNCLFTNNTSSAQIILKELPAKALGGVIFISADGNFICDNSYATRLSLARQKHLHKICSLLSDEHEPKATG